MAPLLITPSEAAKLSSSERIVFVDTTWFMPGVERDAKEDFIKHRLPGARFFDLDKVAMFTEEGRKLNLAHMMPPPQIFATACENMGIEPHTRVILYDSHGVFSSPRALFTFRAFNHTNSSVLNGGLPQWLDQGYRFESGPLHGAAATGARYPLPKFNAEMIKSYKQMADNSVQSLDDTQTDFVLDARPNKRYLGLDPEPRPGIPSGHIPNSFSLPSSVFLKSCDFSNEKFIAEHPDFADRKYTALAEPGELDDGLIASVGTGNASAILNGRRSAAVSCGSGMTAAILWLGIARIRESRDVNQQSPTNIRVSLYDESWTGYAGRPESKIATGERYEEKLRTGRT